MEWVLPETAANFFENILTTKSIKDKKKYFSPEYSDLSDPFTIPGTEDACKVIKNAILNKKKIYIHGDFDVDGITATSIMWNYLYKDLSANVIPFIPNRFTDGYGLNEENIKKLIADGADLIITVDCGVKDIELVAKYSKEVDFIITDHHTIRQYDEKNKVKNSIVIGEYIVSSKAKAVVHPKLTHEITNEFCGAAVAWKLCCGLNKYMEAGIDMNKYIDLACIGTICDIMPLTDENRIIVQLGLNQIKKTQNIGLETLIEICAIDPNKIDTYHIGFIIGPRINASGRMETAMDAVRLFTTNSKDFAIKLAEKLDKLNKERQEATKNLTLEAESKIESHDKKIHFIYGNEWPEGIVGLIAGKLTEKYNRPFIVGSMKDGVIKASARSIEGINITEILKAHESLLIRYGGHAQAAGLSIEENKYTEFALSIENLIADKFTENIFTKKIRIDGLIQLNDINEVNATTLLAFAPYGAGNAKPLLMLKDFEIKNFKLMGKDSTHIKIPIGNMYAEVIGFNIANELLNTKKDKFDIAGHLDLDSWNGQNKAVFKILHFR
jgi:single-stranded-DNA-specific exonuclease